MYYYADGTRDAIVERSWSERLVHIFIGPQGLGKDLTLLISEGVEVILLLT